MNQPSAPPPERFALYRRYMALALHPNGDLLYSSDISGQFNLWRQPVLPTGVPGYSRALTGYRDRAVRSIVVSEDGHWAYFTADQDGDEQFQIYRVPANGGEVQPITQDRKVRHELHPGGLRRDGRMLLYCDNGRDPKDMDAIARDLVRNTSTRPLSPGYLWALPTWDPTGRRFSAVQFHSNTKIHSFVYDVRRETTEEILPHDEERIVVAVDWTRDGKGLLILSDLEREFTGLDYYEIERRTAKPLATPPHDVETVGYAHRTGAIVIGVNEDGYTGFYGGRPGARFRRIPARLPGCLGFTWGANFAVSTDGKRAAAVWETGTKPCEILLLDLPRKRSSWATDGFVGGVPDGPLRPPQLVRIQTWDGRRVPTFYYRPKGRIRGRMPAVLSIHGGPESNERPGWQYAGLYAYLNAHGIAVVAPNIRGSTGYGRSYQVLIHHDWGGGELRDLEAVTQWMQGRPELDAHRFAVFGGSFGGFATLSCVTRLPQYWKAAVDIFGPSNLVTFARSVPPFWLRFMSKWVGDPDTEEAFLRERSPITYVDQVRADLLVIQGAQDPRVVKAESDQMVERLRAMGRSVDYLVFEDEGHGFTRVENMRKAYNVIGTFLAVHLSGND